MSLSLETLALAKKYTKSYVDEHGGGGGGGGSSVTCKSLTLSTSWVGNASPYTQTVSISGYTVTSKTKVDLTADEAAIAVMQASGTERIYISQNNGQLTAYAIGGKPTASMTVNAIIQEVV